MRIIGYAAIVVVVVVVLVAAIGFAEFWYGRRR